MWWVPLVLGSTTGRLQQVDLGQGRHVETSAEVVPTCKTETAVEVAPLAEWVPRPEENWPAVGALIMRHCCGPVVALALAAHA